MHSSSKFTAAVIIGLLTCSVASASDFVSYEGNNAVQVGTGGEKHVVNGIDFWANGAPPRKFKIIGYITDVRHKSGLFGMIRMSGLEPHIAKEAKDAGADAVILMDAEAVTDAFVSSTQANSTGSANTSGNINANTYGNTTTGTFGSTTTAQTQSNSTTYSRAIQHEQTKYAVVKYLNDDASQAPAAAANAKAAQSQ